MNDVVELRHVSVRFGDVTALDGVSISIGRGERVALLGSSGSGKSTLLAVASGRRPVSTGAVSVLGSDPWTELRATGRRRRRYGRRIGTVRQHDDLPLALRVVHNVNAGRVGHWSTTRSIVSLISPRERESARAELDRVGLADRIDTPTGSLSGGERQRVAVARVLRQAPELVLADEPTSSLDPRRSHEIVELLTDPTSARTLVVALHDPDLARRHVDRIIGLRQGRITIDETARTVSDADLATLYDHDDLPA